MAKEPFKLRKVLIALFVLLNGSLSMVTGADIFPDKALDRAVRKEVFDKRGNQKPLTLDDLAKISRVVGKGEKIVSLEGLQHCHSLLDIDLENNEIADCSPLRELKLVQKITLSGNKIETIEPLKELTSLQYLDVSRNKIKDLEPIRAMRNLRSLYFEENQIRSLAPLEQCKKLWSVYGSKNPIENFLPLSTLPNVDTLQLNQTGLADLSRIGLFGSAFEEGRTKLKNLELRDNQITDLSLLVEMGGANKQRSKSLSNLEIDLTGNPLSDSARTEQIPKLQSFNVFVELNQKQTSSSLPVR
jgi:Leucine-rich repeat (LRR) protein